jgi:hypothetical protein
VPDLPPSSALPSPLNKKKPAPAPGWETGGLSSLGQVLFTDKDASGGENELLVVIMINDDGACEKVPKEVLFFSE